MLENLPDQEFFCMRFSIIMPILNEEVILAYQLDRLVQQCARQDYELLLVDGGSTDRTVEIAQQYGQVLKASRGRARQMNAGAAVASGDVLLFLHADTELPDNVFLIIEKALAAPEVVAGAFRLCFNCERLAYKMVAFITNLRSQTFTVFTGDQAYFMRKTSFQEVGGYPDQPLMEDLEIIVRLRKIGTVLLVPHYVKTSARRHEKVGLFRSVLFMWYLRTLYKFGVSPGRLQLMYGNVR
jgi:rSAM/selenodomain-associated transferase 2